MGKPKAPKAPDYAAAATAQGQADREAAITTTNINRANQITPEGTLTWGMRPGADPNNPQAGDYTQTMQYSPEQQRLYDLNNQISSGFLESGIEGLDRVGGIMQTPFQTEGLPQLQGLDRSRVGGLPTVDDASRQRVEQAMLSRVEPQFQRDEAALKTQLLNSGIEMGSEAYSREMDRLDRARNDARMQAVLGGGQEQSRMAQLAAALQGQAFGQEVQGQQFDNQARQQGLQEQSFLRSLPINEINALRTGSQMSGPQFQGYYTGGTAQAAPLFDAMMAQGNFDQASYQNQLSGYNALLGGLTGMGGAYLGRR